MNITIEPVQNSELEVLTAISRKTFYDTFYMDNTPADMDLFLEQHLTENVLKEQLLIKENFFFFAKAGKAVVGYLKLCEGKNPEQFGNTNTIEISRLYALQDCIGLGVGKAMMFHAIAFAKDNNKAMVWLGVWEHNRRAIDFYKRFGFEKFGEHLFTLGTDEQTDWLMKKKL